MCDKSLGRAAGEVQWFFHHQRVVKLKITADVFRELYASRTLVNVLLLVGI